MRNRRTTNRSWRRMPPGLSDRTVRLNPKTRISPKMNPRMAPVSQKDHVREVEAGVLTENRLFSLYESFGAREELVVPLDALAGAPRPGVHIPETAAELGTRPGGRR